jgi:aminoglycoside phosphotransferase (APT) family kinase protein
MEHPSRAGAIGRACAALHDALAAVDAPPGLRAAAAGGPRRLLHLDLHPFNVVVDGAGAPTGTIDWANAAAGRWAYEFMLADLSGRYPEAELAPIRPPTDRTG